MSENKKGKFIVIEGIDGSGKSTQTKLLIARLKKNKLKVKTMHFPQHGHEVFGNLVDSYLNNHFGHATRLDYRLASVLYAADRFEAKEKINRWLGEGYWVVLDRYTESNFGHQASKVRDKEKRLQIMEWLYNLDYKVFKNPKPDMTIFLQVDEKLVSKLMDKMGKSKDGHEGNVSFLRRSRIAYQEACDKFGYWKKIKCVVRGKLLSIDEIHQKVWDMVSKYL